MLGKDTPSNPWATSSPQCQLIVANDVDDDDDDYAPPALSNVFVLWLVFIFYLRPKKKRKNKEIQKPCHVHLCKSMSICLKCSKELEELTKPMPNALQIKIAQPLCHNEMALCFKPKGQRGKPGILMKFLRVEIVEPRHREIRVTLFY